jgi:hypothetical protein
MGTVTVKLCSNFVDYLTIIISSILIMWQNKKVVNSSVFMDASALGLLILLYRNKQTEMCFIIIRSINCRLQSYFLSNYR